MHLYMYEDGHGCKTFIPLESILLKKQDCEVKFRLIEEKPKEKIIYYYIPLYYFSFYYYMGIIFYLPQTSDIKKIIICVYPIT